MNIKWNYKILLTEKSVVEYLSKEEAVCPVSVAYTLQYYCLFSFKEILIRSTQISTEERFPRN